MATIFRYHHSSSQKCHITSQSEDGSKCAILTGPEKRWELDDEPVWDLTDPYACSLKIPRASKSDFTTWTCRLAASEYDKIDSETVNVTVYSKAEVLALEQEPWTRAIF